jgi:hypothetical protein
MLFLGPLRSLRFVEADTDSLGIQRVLFATLHENGSRGMFDLMNDAASTSTEIEVLGESAGLSLQFFPQGFRMLRARDTPLHRGLAEGRRLIDFARDSLGDRIRRSQCSYRARSHADLFAEFVAALQDGKPNPVPATGVLETIGLLDEIAVHSYGTRDGESAYNGKAVESAAAAGR